MKFPREKFMGSNLHKSFLGPGRWSEIADDVEVLWNATHEAYKAELREGITKIPQHHCTTSGSRDRDRLLARVDVLALFDGEDKDESMPKIYARLQPSGNYGCMLPDTRKEQQRQGKEELELFIYPNVDEGVDMFKEEDAIFLPDRRQKDRRESNP